MSEFLLSAESEVAVLQSGMKQVESLRLKLAEFFCEDAATFKLEECFKIFQSFCDKFRQAIKENERRVQQEKLAEERNRIRAEQLARRSKQSMLPSFVLFAFLIAVASSFAVGQAGTPVSDSDSFLGDGLFDPRASPALSRRQLGSGELNNGFIRIEQEYSASPDITPNGSLRRRPSRVLAGEDDLMEYLRSSGPHGHDGIGHISRDRKAAYGSLGRYPFSLYQLWANSTIPTDRSWARRARSGSSSRKRPDILNIDFGVDRERASSPAPLLQQQQQQQQDRIQSPLASSGTGTPTTAANTPISNGPTIPQMPAAHEDAKPR